MPIFHNCLGVFLFLVSPIIHIFAYFVLLGTVETKVLFMYFTFSTIHTILFTLWFFMVLLDVFEGLKMKNAQERKIVVKSEKKYNRTARDDQVTPGKEFADESDGEVRQSETAAEPQEIKK